MDPHITDRDYSKPLPGPGAGAGTPASKLSRQLAGHIASLLDSGDRLVLAKTGKWGKAGVATASPIEYNALVNGVREIEQWMNELNGNNPLPADVIDKFAQIHGWLGHATGDPTAMSLSDRLGKERVLAGLEVVNIRNLREAINETILMFLTNKIETTDENGNFEPIVAFLKQGLQLQQQLKVKLMSFECYGRISGLLFDKKQFKEAIEVLKLIPQTYGFDPELIKDNYKELFETFLSEDLPQYAEEIVDLMPPEEKRQNYQELCKAYSESSNPFKLLQIAQLIAEGEPLSDEEDEEDLIRNVINNLFDYSKRPKSNPEIGLEPEVFTQLAIRLSKNEADFFEDIIDHLFEINQPQQAEAFAGQIKKEEDRATANQLIFTKYVNNGSDKSAMEMLDRLSYNWANREYRSALKVLANRFRGDAAVVNKVLTLLGDADEDTIYIIKLRVALLGQLAAQNKFEEALHQAQFLAEKLDRSHLNETMKRYSYIFEYSDAETVATHYEQIMQPIIEYVAREDVPTALKMADLIGNKDIQKAIKQSIQRPPPESAAGAG